MKHKSFTYVAIFLLTMALAPHIHAQTRPEAPDKIALWEEARDALDDRDWSIAWPALEQLANLGDEEAALELANMLDQGLGLRKDRKKAFTWYHKAAEKRNITGMREVARRLLQGEGVDRNPPQAALWYFAAAQTGDPEASWALARLYESGIGVKQNIALALGWYSLAGQRGWKPALDRLSQIASRQQRLDSVPIPANRDALAAAAPRLPVLIQNIEAQPAKPAAIEIETPSDTQEQAPPAFEAPRPAPDLFTNQNPTPVPRKPLPPPSPPKESPGPAFGLVLEGNIDPNSPPE